MTTTHSAQTADSPHCPLVRGGVLDRPSLVARLAEAARVTQISAPAGSGKTFLLRSWMAEPGLADSAALVPVQRGETDPQRFWISVLDALRDTKGGSQLVRELTAAPDLDGWTVVERLLEDLRQLREPLWLVIDDTHELRSGETVRQLELLIMRAPPELRFVFGARHDLRLGLHRLRLEGELAEIRAADLRFTVDEARALLEAAGVTLPDPVLALLHARTEGWAAGLRLAALSLAGHPAPERFAAEFSGTDRTVAEYLLAEVLERQSEEARRLLLRTSMLERVSGPLADLLTGGSGGERMLQDLEETVGFVVSLDGPRTWFRYHGLFADLLQRELRRTEPDRLTALQRAAAGWYAEHGYPVEAVRQAQAAQAWSLAVRVLSDHFLGLILDGRGSTAHELLGGFPADLLATDPELAVLMGADELFGKSLKAAERHLARAAEGMASIPADRRGHFQVDLVTMRLSLAQRRGDLPAVVAEANRLLAYAEDPDAAHRFTAVGDELYAMALVTLGTAELWAFQAGEAERHLDQGVALARQIGRPWLEVSGLAHGAWAASFRSIALAAERSTQAIGLAEEHGWSQEPIVGVAYAALGAIRVWQLRLDEAQELLARAERALRAEAEPAAGVVLHQVRGMLELARDRDADALDAFRIAEKLAGLLVKAYPRSTPMRAFLVRALVRLGENDRAGATLAETDGEERATGDMRIALAVLRLAQHNPRAATTALGTVLDGSAQTPQPVWQIEALLLDAIARHALSDPVAGNALERALDLAEPDGVVFPFLLHPAPELLRRHARDGTAHPGLISRVLSLFPGPQEHGGAATLPVADGSPDRIVLPAGALPEPLTGSETRILRYLVTTHLAAPEIARELFVSVNTIRTHMRHIYEKLGVHRRSEAADRARALGLFAHSPRS